MLAAGFYAKNFCRCQTISIFFSHIFALLHHRYRRRCQGEKERSEEEKNGKVRPLKSERKYFMWIVTPIQTIYLVKQIKFKFNAKNKKKNRNGKKSAYVSIKYVYGNEGKKRQNISYKHSVRHRNSDETTAQLGNAIRKQNKCQRNIYSCFCFSFFLSFACPVLETFFLLI